MIINLAAAALLVPLTALMLAARVSAKADEQLTAAAAARAQSASSRRNPRGQSLLRNENEMKTSVPFVIGAVVATIMLLSSGPTFAQQGPPGCNWKKYLYAQDAVKQGKIDTNLLNQMSAMASAQGYSLTNKVLQTCNGWLMEGKRADGSPAILFVDPKTQTIVDADFR